MMMTDIYAIDDVIEQVAPLTHERLQLFEQLQIIVPVQTPNGPRYQALDIRRITLLCELTDDFEVNEDALVIITSPLDQLHGAHERLDRVLEAVRAEPSETQLRVSQRLASFDAG